MAQIYAHACASSDGAENSLPSCKKIAKERKKEFNTFEQQICDFTLKQAN